MRSLTAIICLTAFFALQYGKLISYWHCRLVSISSAAPCDCIQQLLDVHKEGDSRTTATVKEKTEDIVLFHEQPQPNRQPVATIVTHTIAYIFFTPQSGNRAVFQPPRV